MARWNWRVNVGDVFHDDDLSLGEKRDVIVKRLRAGAWITADEDGEFEALIDELAEVETVPYFDSVWSYIYDWADANRLWIETWRSSESTRVSLATE